MRKIIILLVMCLLSACSYRDFTDAINSDAIKVRKNCVGKRFYRKSLLDKGDKSDAIYEITEVESRFNQHAQNNLETVVIKTNLKTGDKIEYASSSSFDCSHLPDYIDVDTYEEQETAKLEEKAQQEKYEAERDKIIQQNFNAIEASSKNSAIVKKFRREAPGFADQSFRAGCPLNHLVYRLKEGNPDGLMFFNTGEKTLAINFVSPNGEARLFFQKDDDGKIYLMSIKEGSKTLSGNDMNMVMYTAMFLCVYD